MIRRLVMSLLLLMLSVPAMAAPLCHAEPAPECHETARNDEAPAKRTVPADAMGVHGCIGCIAPRYETAAAIVTATAPTRFPAIVPSALIPVTTAPATPPPRT